ncbi:MAG TPA: hypothetical protein EYQ64_07705 [Gemmatimonadetes bacterium]|nr:hypothetical protein [Gemmatimonadota bacterium]
MKLSIAHIILIGYALVGLTFAAVSATVYRDIVLMRDSEAWVEHTLDMRNHLGTILSALQDAETGQRGYLLTGEESYLEPYRTGSAAITAEIASIRALTENPMQHANLDLLGPLVSAKFGELDQTIEVRRSIGFAAALAIVSTGRGKAVMDQIRSVLSTMDTVEDVLLDDRVREEEEPCRRHDLGHAHRHPDRGRCGCPPGRLRHANRHRVSQLVGGGGSRSGEGTKGAQTTCELPGVARIGTDSPGRRTERCVVGQRRGVVRCTRLG